MKETKYPIYVISKGRAENRQTINTLEEMNVRFLVVVEPQEVELYAKYVDRSKIIATDFANLDQGSIPVRNFVWQHSINAGARKHWILDDNINGFVRLNKGLRIPVKSSAIFNAVEDFSDRYTNVRMSGMNYRYFAGDWIKKPYFLNTRIYSCILLDNSVTHRWRGKYNEDTDLSLRILKDDHCTLLFNTFLANKAATLTMSGGNTEEVYENSNNRLDFAESLKEQHSDCVRVVWRYDRWHHEVNYDIFKKNKLIRVDNYNEIVKQGINNYQMTLKRVC